jgi:REP element-mobilizing transposase RayT
MTAPRQVLPGTTYLVTRRCARRQYFLRPSRIAKEVFLYVLAVAARRYGVEVHAYCVLSNHYHLVVSDPLARLPAFELYLDGIVARAINALLGRDEDFWGPNSFSAVALVAPRDVVDKAAYTLANPVAAGLVRSARRWPGLWSPPEAVGAGEIQVQRPRHFFDPEGGLPDVITLQLTTPPGFPSAEAFRERLTAELAEREAKAVSAATGFLGVARVLAQRPTAQPRNREPRGRLRPRVAARDKWKRIEALGRLVGFLTAYRSALRAWRDGQDDVLFPAGTYLMRVLHGATCAGAG